MSTVVVGAGLAGLTAARRLRDQGEEVVVLEATEVPGGRTRTLRDRMLHGEPADVGASMIDVGNDLILRTCRDFGVRLTPRFSLFPEPGDPQPTGASLIRNELYLHGARVEDDARSQLVAEIQGALEGSPPAPLETLSAWSARAGLSPLASSAFCAQAGLNPVTLPGRTPASHVHPPDIGKLCWLLADGTDSVARALAEGIAIRYSEPARLITHGGRGVGVETDNDILEADDVVIATSVRTILGIGFDPVLPEWKVTAVLSTPMTQGSKLAAQYSAGRELLDRMGPGILSDGPVPFVWARPVGQDDTVVLHGLAPDRGDGFFRDEAAVLDALDAMIAAIVGDSPGRLAGMVQDWTDEEYVRGIVSDLSADPDGLPALLAQGLGTVHFAGEHTADEWATGMEGAMRSGLRAADDVLRRRRARSSAC